MITPTDISTAIAEAEKLAATTAQVCSSSSVPEYQAHMNALADMRDALASVKIQIIAQKQEWANQEREIKRIIDKLEDHRMRSASALKSLRDARSQQIP